MANFDIVLNIKDGKAIGQIRQVDRELRKVEKSGSRVKGLFKGLFVGVGVSLALREFVQLSNASVGIENRLKLVEEQVGDTEVAFQRLRDISRATRSPLEENAALFQRVAQAQKELGATNEQLFQFVQATGTALAIQGGAANTARGALVQLSQSIGATIVRAEEFNSILEGALPLAQAAARGIDEAGGSVAKLRQLVIAGEISSKEFFQAIIAEQENLATLFEQTTPTIGQAFVVMRNEAIATFRVFDEATGTTAFLAEGLLLVADNFELIGRLLAAGAITAGLILIPILIGAITSSIIALTVAAALNPIGALLIALAAGVGLIIAFGDKLRLFGRDAGTVADFVAVAFGRLSAFLQKVFGGAWNWIQANFFDKVNDFSFANLIRSIAYLVDTTQAMFAGMSAAAQSIFSNMGTVITSVLVTAFVAAAGALQGLLNLAIDGINALGGNIARVDFATKLLEKYAPEMAGAGVMIGDAFVEGFTTSLNDGSAQNLANDMLDESRVRATLAAEDAAMAISTIPAIPDGVTASVDGLADSLGGGGKKSAAGGAGAAKKSFSDLFAEIEAGQNALKKMGVQQDIYNEQMRVAEAIGRKLTDSESALIDAATRKTEILQTASDIYDDLNSSAREYMNTQAALQQLLADGAINESQAAQAIANTGLAGDLQSTDESLGGLAAYESQLEQVRQYTTERTNILQAAREADLINEEEYSQRLKDLTRTTQLELTNVEIDRWDFAISSASGSINSIMSLMDKYGDKQSAAYKTMFKVQKAFAIAEATVNTARSVTNALAAPFPPPIPQALAAAAAVAGGAEIAAILATSITGLKDGGRVNGPGGPRDDKAGLFALSNGEMVVNAAATAANLPLLEAMNRGINIRGMLAEGGMIGEATKSLPRLSAAGASETANASRTKARTTESSAPEVNVPVNVINVASEEAALAAVASRGGQDTILNVIANNRSEIQSLLG
jgi:tape measure domain-containing protein